MHIELDSNGQYAGPVEIYLLTAPNGKQYVGQSQCHRRSGKKWAAKGFKGRWYVAVIKHGGKLHRKSFTSKSLSMPEKLRLTVEARDKILKDLGLPAITDDPPAVN